MKITTKLATIAASGAAAVAVAGTAAVAMTPAAAHAADVPGARQLFVNNHSNQCLQPESTTGANGVRMVQGYCENGQKAQWSVERVGTSRDFRIVNADSGKCLEIADSRKDNGAPAQQWTCVDKVDTQLWQFDTLNDIALVTNKNSGKVLEIDNSSLKPGARAQQWSYANTAKGQSWRLPKVPGTSNPTPQPSVPPTTAPTPRPTTAPSTAPRPTAQPSMPPTTGTQPSAQPTTAPQPSKAPTTPQPAVTPVGY
ncbi:RICIN domain-containing protein [Streptomyces triculaminicus]|uniref:RICIN domain-containing protein n=1 Tax=Streptomyces triculaminicus TaxID=2816232 RepID=UPI0034065568